MPATYDAFADFYDLEYGHKEDDLPFYLDAAARFGSPLLEIGAGTGRIALRLAEAGFEVWGLEHSARMLAIAGRKRAVKKLSSLHLIQGDMRRFDLGRRFPLCIVPFRAFLHNLSEDDQLSALRNIRNHLNPGGILVMDLFVPLHHVLARDDWHEEIAPEELSEPSAAVSIYSRVVHQPELQRLIIHNTYRRPRRRPKTLKMTYRYIFRYELELLLRMSGFTVTAVFGGFDEQPYDYHSGIMVCIARTGLEIPPSARSR